MKPIDFAKGKQFLQSKYLPLIFFGILLVIGSFIPAEIYFDETHYVPASKSLILLKNDLTPEHPPLSKLILGGSWFIFTFKLNLIPEYAAFRLIAAMFGLWLLFSIYSWAVQLGFSKSESLIAVWLTGFSFLWFVQSKIAMIDIFYLAFCFWGVLDVYRNSSGWKFWRGWLFLGLALACKWAAAPYFLVAVILSRSKIQLRSGGLLIAGLVYLLAFVPLAWLHTGAVPLSNFINHQKEMYDALSSITNAEHPYRSHWWEWPPLIRPMWYYFETTTTSQGGIWAGGNPLIFWASVPFIVIIPFMAFTKRTRVSIVLSLMYWIPFLFWIVIPRKLQFFYYYLGPSLLLGPILIWAHREYFLKKVKPGVTGIFESENSNLYIFTLACGVLFIFFLPILLGINTPKDFYTIYMWFDGWI